MLEQCLNASRDLGILQFLRHDGFRYRHLLTQTWIPSLLKD
jgi:hypothetical protein